MTRDRRRAHALLTLLTLAPLLLAGCIRVDSAPEPTRSASAAVTERDALATSLAEVQNAVDAASENSLAANLERHSLEALVAGVGPEYVAYPAAEPSASPSPEATSPDLVATLTAALDTSVDLAQSATDGDVRAWATTASLVHGLALWAEQIDGAVYAQVPAARALPTSDAPDAGTVPSSTAVASDQLAELALRHDQARYVYELIATRESGADRANALARAAIHEERSDALQALAGGADARTEVYSTLATSVEDAASRAATARAAEDAVASAYAADAIEAGSSDVRWLMDGAYDAYAAAMLVDGWTVWELPDLPGLTQIATTSASPTAEG
ncbi:DUF4439 domain-containing protein [Demequina capsici]|uniref:DUF4439 domain-containing protein n=1 Tax=Demequina capsici TaxID=3075620 RepID=A0AA96F8U2_9MICO|nr:DUF4439 domain-containing protein [Demequina sp. PMTSA13]WNM26286.1 DUF4439 domain-containing protein [Demequina sp. PMTSA13]